MRERLANRHAATNLHFEHEGLKYVLTYSRFPDRRIAEIFVNTQMRSGSMADVSVQDGAVFVSLALQHGCPIETMKDAIKRNPNGTAQSPLGMAIDIISKEEF